MKFSFRTKCDFGDGHRKVDFVTGVIRFLPIHS